MQAGKHLRDAAARRISPDNDVSKLELLGQAFDVLDVILHEIRSLWIPTGLAVSTHVDGHHVIVLVEVGCDVVKRVRHTPDAVQHDQRRLPVRAPVEIMDAKIVDGDETVHRLGLRLGRLSFGLFCCDGNPAKRFQVGVQLLRTRRELVGLEDERDNVAIALAGQTVGTVRRHQPLDS